MRVLKRLFSSRVQTGNCALIARYRAVGSGRFCRIQLGIRRREQRAVVQHDKGGAIGTEGDQARLFAWPSA